MNQFQTLKRAVDEKIGLPDMVLTAMATACLNGDGVIREPYRRRLLEKAPEEALALMEKEYRVIYARHDADSRTRGSA